MIKGEVYPITFIPSSCSSDVDYSAHDILLVLCKPLLERDGERDTGDGVGLGLGLGLGLPVAGTIELQSSSSSPPTQHQSSSIQPIIIVVEGSKKRDMTRGGRGTATGGRGGGIWRR